MKRVTVGGKKPGGDYFPTRSIKFISSGCTLLDCVLGGGWALGRISNIVGDKAVGKCARDFYFLAEDGLHYSDDFGQNFEEGATSISWNLALDRNENVTANYFWKQQVEHTQRFETKRGLELTATVDHQVLTMLPSGQLTMRRMEALQPGDWVAVSTTKGLFAKECIKLPFVATAYESRKYKHVDFPKVLDETLANWLGALLADGTISSGPLGISAHKSWKRKLVQRWSEELFPGAFTVKPDGFVYSREVQEFVQFILEKPLKGTTARFKVVPTKILRSPASVQAAFLKALMDFDGYLRPDWGLCYSTASRRLAREVQLMLLNFGIFGLLEKGQVKLPQWEQSREYYGVVLSGNRFDAFREKIGVFRKVTKRKSTRSHSSIESIPFGNTVLRAEITRVRKRLGWRKNGKLRDGRRFPSLGAFCIPEGSISYDRFEEHCGKLQEFASPKFKEYAASLLEQRYFFDKVVEKTDCYGPQTVYDVHVPGRHLFWANGLVNHNTLLAIEACANFAVKYPKGRIWYREGEAAFDEDYARRLGLPVDQVDFGPEGINSVWDTVEKVFVDLEQQLDRAKKDKIPAGLYIIDSLDALSSEAELEREIGKGSYNLEKQKRLGELFRRLVRKVRDNNVHLMFISQIRDKIGIVFGDKHTRTGGKSLDFYASQILWLYNAGVKTATMKGIKRAVAVATKAKCKKNKIAEAMRECAFEIRFGYGVDDLRANLEWLEEVKKLQIITPKTVEKYLAEIEALDDKRYHEKIKWVSDKVISLWLDVEEGFRPKRSKYQL